MSLRVMSALKDRAKASSTTSLLVKCCKNEQIKRRIPPPWRPIPHSPPSDPSPCKVLF